MRVFFWEYFEGGLYIVEGLDFNQRSKRVEEQLQTCLETAEQEELKKTYEYHDIRRSPYFEQIGRGVSIIKTKTGEN